MQTESLKKKIYKNIKVKTFELRAENDKAFKLRVDVESTEDSYTRGWPINTPSLEITRSSRGMTNGWIASGSALAHMFSLANYFNIFYKI